MQFPFFLLIPLLHFATATYGPPHSNSAKCLSTTEATLFATQILNIPTLPIEDRLPALQILAQENFTFTSDGASFFLRLPLHLPISTSIPSYLDYIAPIPASTKPWTELLWIGNTCDTITIYREYYFGKEEFPVRSIDFFTLTDQNGDWKLKEWIAAVNGAAALYAHERVEYTEKAFPQRSGQGVGVGRDGVEVEESAGCGKKEGRCLGGKEARRIVEDYGKLLVSRPVDERLAERLLNEDAEMISDSMGFVTMGLVNRTNIKSRAEFVERAIGVLQNVTGGEPPMKILKVAWNCDAIVQYVEFTVPGDVSAGRPTLPVRGFRIFLMDLQSRKIRKVFWEFNSGAWQYALDQIDFKEPFNVTVADDGAKYEEYSCGGGKW